MNTKPEQSTALPGGVWKVDEEQASSGKSQKPHSFQARFNTRKHLSKTEETLKEPKSKFLKNLFPQFYIQ